MPQCTRGCSNDCYLLGSRLPLFCLHASAMESEGSCSALPGLARGVTAEDIAAFGGAPLAPLGLDDFVTVESHRDSAVLEELPVHVDGHPCASGHAAGTMLHRLQIDMAYFARRTRQGTTAHLTGLAEADVWAFARAPNPKWVEGKRALLATLEAKLQELQRHDSDFVSHTVLRVLAYMNTPAMVGTLEARQLQQVVGGWGSVHSPSKASDSSRLLCNVSS